MPTVAAMELLDPKNDYVFKRLFAESPDLLAELISAVRRDEPPVQVVEVMNPVILPEDLSGKSIELDVLARDAAGRLFNIEVQVQRFPKWSARSAFYLSRMLTSQIGAGEPYVALKPVVGVHLLDFNLFDAHPCAVWQFEMRDRQHPSVRLGDELTLHVVELPKADRQWRMRDDPEQDVGLDIGLPTPLQAWIAFLKHWKETEAMSDIAYPPVQQALNKLERISSSEQDRFRALARERALYNELTLLTDAREEGREEGQREGLNLARAMLSHLLVRRFGPLPEWVDRQVQDASLDQLMATHERALDAPSLEAVFSRSTN